MEMDGLDESRIARAMQANGARNHHAALEKKHGTATFWRTMVNLIDPPYTREKLTAFFDNRASYDSIRHWRYGHSYPPRWAYDLIHRNTLRRIAELHAVVEQARQIKTSPGQGWNKGAKTLAVWRERKARERDAQKEKAASEAALDNKNE